MQAMRRSELGSDQPCGRPYQGTGVKQRGRFVSLLSLSQERNQSGWEQDPEGQWICLLTGKISALG